MGVCSYKSLYSCDKDKTFFHRLQIFSSKNEALSTENTFSPTNVSPSDVFRHYFDTPLGHTLQGIWCQISLHSKTINNAGSKESASLLSQQPCPALFLLCFARSSPVQPPFCLLCFSRSHLWLPFSLHQHHAPAVYPHAALLRTHLSSHQVISHASRGGVNTNRLYRLIALHAHHDDALHMERA